MKSTLLEKMRKWIQGHAGPVACGGILLAVVLLPVIAQAGSLDSPAAPTDAGSAMYGLEDLYNRLNSGVAGAKRSGAFTEPSAGPGATGRTLDEVMALAPAVDNVNGAAPADVAAGKTYWGLRTDGTWGPQTGTGAATASLAPVEKSGQAISYATGDDGALRTGVAWPNPRFTDNGNGTVTDNLTGLIWLKNANCFGGRSWDTALADASGLNTDECGLTDGSEAGAWRLPQIKELQSLIDFSRYPLALPAGHPFTDAVSNHYWSSTTYAGYSTHAWIVNLSNGDIDGVIKTVTIYVWPVRRGQ